MVRDLKRKVAVAPKPEDVFTRVGKTFKLYKGSPKYRNVPPEKMSMKIMGSEFHGCTKCSFEAKSRRAVGDHWRKRHSEIVHLQPIRHRKSRAMSEADKLRKFLYPKPKNLALMVKGTSTTREFNLYSKNQLNKKMQGVEHIDFTKKLRDEQSQTDAECIAHAKLMLHEEAA